MANNLKEGVSTKASRDIRFNLPSDFDWTQGQAGASLERISKLSHEYAAAAVEWYLSRKGWERLGGRATRLCAILLVLAAGLVPLIGEIVQSNGQPGINPLWASVTLVLAAGAVGIDRFFGFSAAYMRYLAASMKLQRHVQDFSFEWQARRAALAGAEPTPAQVQEALDACKRFLVAVDQTIQTETESWVQDFTTALAEIDKTTRVQVEAARAGAINIKLSNADQCDHGWQLVIDGGTPEQRTGKTAAVRGLIEGNHSIAVRGEINNVPKMAERNVIVTAGTVFELELTLA